MQVRAAHAVIRHLDVDVGLFPGFRLELLPDHLAVDGGGFVGRPPLELVVRLA